jgi:hypothetical protein
VDVELVAADLERDGAGKRLTTPAKKVRAVPAGRRIA